MEDRKLYFDLTQACWFLKVDGESIRHERSVRLTYEQAQLRYTQGTPISEEVNMHNVPSSLDIRWG